MFGTLNVKFLLIVVNQIAMGVVLKHSLKLHFDMSCSFGLAYLKQLGLDFHNSCFKNTKGIQKVSYTLTMLVKKHFILKYATIQYDAHTPHYFCT